MTNASTEQEFELLVVARKSVSLLILLTSSEITTKIRKDILRKIWRLCQIGECKIYHDSDVCFDFYG